MPRATGCSSSAPSGDAARSDSATIAVDSPNLLEELRGGDLVALGDGGVQLDVREVHADHADAVVLSGGRLQGRPGVNVPPERFSAATPTADDLRLLEAMIDTGIDAAAVSFVRDAADVRAVRVATEGTGLMLVAKIETKTAVDDIDQIIDASDGVMVARGDLGVRLPLEEVPHLQKQIIRSSVAFGRPVITATQMLESMVHAPTPTRAEVADVANAVFDGTSALMLSAETAIGRNPVAAVANHEPHRRARRARLRPRRLGTEARASADVDHGECVIRRPRDLRHHRGGVARSRGLRCRRHRLLHQHRPSARAIARFRPTAPLLAFTPSVAVARQLSVAWGLTAVATGEHMTSDEIVWVAVETVGGAASRARATSSSCWSARRWTRSRRRMCSAWCGCGDGAGRGRQRDAT